MNPVNFKIKLSFFPLFFLNAVRSPIFSSYFCYCERKNLISKTIHFCRIEVDVPPGGATADSGPCSVTTISSAGSPSQTTATSTGQMVAPSVSQISAQYTGKVSVGSSWFDLVTSGVIHQPFLHHLA